MPKYSNPVDAYLAGKGNLETAQEWLLGQYGEPSRIKVKPPCFSYCGEKNGRYNRQIKNGAIERASELAHSLAEQFGYRNIEIHSPKKGTKHHVVR